MKPKLLLSIATLLIIGMTGCSKDSGSGSGGATVNYQINTINKTYTIPNSTSSLSWLSGYANITKIEFEAEGTASHVNFETKSPQKIDIFSTAALGSISIPAGTYTKAEFEIKFGKGSNLDAFQLTGKLDANPIIFKVAEDGEYEADAELANVTIAPKTYSATITFDFSKLTSGISIADLKNAIKDNTGTIIISSTTNGSLYGIMKDNLKKLVATVDFR